jgi:uncharacterized membrane protein YgcG
MPQHLYLLSAMGGASFRQEKLCSARLSQHLFRDAKAMRSVSTSLMTTHLRMECTMKSSLIASSLLGGFALALSATVALAQPGNLGTTQKQLSAASSALSLVRGGGGGGHGGGMGGGGGGHGFSGGHGFHGGQVRGFGFFDGPYYDDYSYDEPGCLWSARYHRWVCY